MSLKLEYAGIARCQSQYVWRVFQEIEQWPRWDPAAIRSARWVSGNPWTKGSRFEISVIRPMPYIITPEILEIEPPIYLHWRGKGSGVTGEQFFIFKPLPDGTTEMRTLQEYSGVPIPFFGNKIRQAILDGNAHLFRIIAEEAEALAASEVDPPAEAL
jgi:hypothetical protein